MNNLFFFFIFFIFRKRNIIVKASKTNNTSINDNKRKLTSTSYIEELIFIDNENEKIAYIASTSNENGDIYLITNSEDASYSKRFIYIIKSNYNHYSKLISMESPISNVYPEISIIKINRIEYIATYSSSDSHFELIGYDTGEVYYSSNISCNLKTSPELLKNTFFSIKYKDNSYYIINAYIDKSVSKLIIQKLFYQDKNIEENLIICSEIGNGLDVNKNIQISCFENGDYIECLYSNSSYLYTVSIFNISNLEELHRQTIEDNYILSSNIFSKCVYIKDNGKKWK